MAQTTNPGVDDVGFMPGHILERNRHNLYINRIAINLDYKILGATNMRQIKFRFVWQIGNTIIKQDLTIDEITAGVVTPKIGGKKAELVHKLQFTGLTDKNGVEIYEGDILNMWYAPRATCKGVVIFNNGSFKFATKQAAPPECHLGDIESLGNYIEVIGNTHQNPELLEK